MIHSERRRLGGEGTSGWCLMLAPGGLGGVWMVDGGWHEGSELLRTLLQLTNALNLKMYLSVLGPPDPGSRPTSNSGARNQGSKPGPADADGRIVAKPESESESQYCAKRRSGFEFGIEGSLRGLKEGLRLLGCSRVSCLSAISIWAWTGRPHAVMVRAVHA
ncbi:hypothetical protein B0H11DRAFT_1919360 [Mycena galericulata]|nr:hypothetical protein B0H11DRAFT_1919360 [Mycena galericulata]